jgi:hypothetical protein
MQPDALALTGSMSCMWWRSCVPVVRLAELATRILFEHNVRWEAVLVGKRADARACRVWKLHSNVKVVHLGVGASQPPKI